MSAPPPPAELTRIALGLSKILKEMGRPQRLVTLPPPIATSVEATSKTGERRQHPLASASTSTSSSASSRTSASITSSSTLPTPSTSSHEPIATPQPQTPVPELPVAAVPSNALHRAMSFASLGAKLIVGTAVDSLSSRISSITDSNADATSATHPSSHFITSKNAERLANHLSRLRGAALKISQVRPPPRIHHMLAAYPTPLLLSRSAHTPSLPAHSTSPY